jgi:hypothetical protein
MLPVFARQSCVYSALSFCISASNAAVLFASVMKEACCASSVDDMAYILLKSKSRMNAETKTDPEECIALVAQLTRVFARFAARVNMEACEERVS